MGSQTGCEPKQPASLLKCHRDETMNQGFELSSAFQQLKGISVALSLTIFAVFILWIFSLIDLLRSEFKRDVNKLVWFFTITIPVLGPLLYIFIGDDQKIEKEAEDVDSPHRRRRI